MPVAGHFYWIFWTTQHIHKLGSGILEKGTGVTATWWFVRLSACGGPTKCTAIHSLYSIPWGSHGLPEFPWQRGMEDLKKKRWQRNQSLQESKARNSESHSVVTAIPFYRLFVIKHNKGRIIPAYFWFIISLDCEVRFACGHCTIWCCSHGRGGVVLGTRLQWLYVFMLVYDDVTGCCWIFHILFLYLF